MIETLVRQLMKHSYFQEEPGSKLLPSDVHAQIVAIRKHHHVSEIELKRFVGIVLRDEYNYCDPISLLTKDWTFRAGICTLEDTEYTRRKQKEQQQRSSEAQRLSRLQAQWDHEYATNPAYRALVDEYKSKNPLSFVRINAEGNFEYPDGTTVARHAGQQSR